MFKKLILIFLPIIIVISSLLLTACNQKKEDKKEGKINIMVSILPQIDFVQRIGGDRVKVTEMIPPGFSPATYNPSPNQLKKLEDANMYFKIGHIPFEKIQMEKLEKINKNMKVIDTSKDITLLKLTDHKHDGEEEELDHVEGDDPHIWLSPRLVKIQAQNIYEALIDYNPENQEYFYKNYQEFINELEELDQKLIKTFEPIKNQTILVYHPAFAYLADAYNFHQEAIEIEGKEPNPSQLKKIIDEAKLDNIKVVFVQSQFSTKSAESIAQEIDGVVIQIDPLAKDYFSNLENMSHIIINSFK
jgi:zinc transport system substrate-binding protein